MLLFPNAILRYITHSSPTFPLTTTSTPTHTSVHLLQWLAALSYALAVPLLIGAQNTPRAKASRQLVYETLGAGEVCLVTVMVWQAIAGAGGEGAGGFTGLTLTMGSLVLGGAALGRAWLVGFKPEWFSEGIEGAGRKRQ